MSSCEMRPKKQIERGLQAHRSPNGRKQGLASNAEAEESMLGGKRKRALIPPRAVGLGGGKMEEGLKTFRGYGNLT